MVYDLAVFYRLGATRFSIGVGPQRTVTRGFSKAEGWEQASGVFSLPIPDTGGYTDVYRDEYSDYFGEAVATVMKVTQPCWDTHRGDDSATLTACVNRVLNGAGYARPDGSPIV